MAPKSWLRRELQSKLRLAAMQQGMVSLRDDGQRLVDAGITTLEEVLRVTREA